MRTKSPPYAIPRCRLVIFRLSWGGGPDAHCRSAAAAVPVHPGVGEAVCTAAVKFYEDRDNLAVSA
jgi:hypothetical protein